MSAQANNLEVLLGELDLDIGESEIIVQTPGTYSALRLGKCAFFFAPNTKANFRVDDGLAVRVVHLLQGALHSVFDPEAVAERAVITRHATIAIRGTALYTELDEEKTALALVVATDASLLKPAVKLKCKERHIILLA